ncbi:uncharacterized protein BP5553_07489 [Venustampulla echinocandica]|uniref:Uncharacterized protein n=1 Tax=Venustampulla echinocandica TaxID=2656787 RepID=A0A370TGN9_9HELO|nr:uncharacterized protein BP5553_07489 [Venustampulla echinocandica]RDL34361.1 hypothetical protein BP5553_07489 [Venustampulla echinocandica]
MASSDILSQALSSITSIKLEELSIQRSTFENAKAELLKAVDAEANQTEKVRMLVDRIESFPSISKVKLGDNAPISLNNIKKFLKQARYDPSVSMELQKSWQIKLQEALDGHSRRYEYASLYGNLVSEWLSASEDGAGSSAGKSTVEEVGRNEMHEQRRTWEDYVFKAHETDSSAVDSYLKAFCRVMTEFANLMGLKFNKEKTGSVKITRKGEKLDKVAAGLPKGDVRWGLLKLDLVTGRFVIDQDSVDEHIEELQLQLRACKSVIEWIQVWNLYGVRYFTTNFGRLANCFGQVHVEMILETFTRIQSQLFASTGGSVTSTLKKMIADRFGVKDIPEGYLYFPMSMGGLDLKSPFVGLNLIHDTVARNPDTYMDDYFTNEESEYRKAKMLFDNGTIPGLSVALRYSVDRKPFMSFEEYTRYREQTSRNLRETYVALTAKPETKNVDQTSDVSSLISSSDWKSLQPSQQWIIQLYAADMISRFGELNVVEKGMLPTGMVSAFRESRFKW